LYIKDRNLQSEVWFLSIFYFTVDKLPEFEYDDCDGDNDGHNDGNGIGIGIKKI